MRDKVVQVWIVTGPQGWYLKEYTRHSITWQKTPHGILNYMDVAAARIAANNTFGRVKLLEMYVTPEEETGI